MRIALVQQHAGSDPQENRRRGLEAVRAAAGKGADMVCFAELSFQPFYPQRPAAADVSPFAEPIPGPTSDAFSEAARELGVVVLPNLFERAGDLCYDTSFLIEADGRLLGRTRMVHITDYNYFHERGYYAPGDTGAPVYHTSVGTVGIAICYDRHYPEYMRALALAGADLVVVPQAGAVGEWPDGLYEAEMQVAAFQNGYFVALCNRVGKEERLEFSGESFVCAPDGRVIARAPLGEDHILIADIDLTETEQSHARRLFLPDRRPELYGPWVTAEQQCPGAEGTQDPHSDKGRRAMDPEIGSLMPSEGLPLTGYKILVVDDDEDTRTFLLAVLADAGAQICEAGDGDEALVVAARDRPDLITLDLSMPGKDGVDTLCDLRQDPALEETPVCVITGHPEFRRVIYDRPTRPPEGFMNKPVDPEELVRTVRRILGLKQRREERTARS